LSFWNEAVRHERVIGRRSLNRAHLERHDHVADAALTRAANIKDARDARANAPEHLLAGIVNSACFERSDR
jgi:hypothetical protein